MAAWDVSVRGAAKLSATLQSNFDDAVLFKELATLRIDRSLLGSVEELRWTGPTAAFAAVCAVIDAPSYVSRAERLARDRSA